MKRSLKKYDNGGKTKRPVFPGKLDNRVVSDNTSVQRPTIQKQDVRLKTPQEVKKANRENFQKRIGVKPTYNVQELTDFGTPEPGLEDASLEALDALSLASGVGYLGKKGLQLGAKGLANVLKPKPYSRLTFPKPIVSEYIPSLPNASSIDYNEVIRRNKNLKELWENPESNKLMAWDGTPLKLNHISENPDLINTLDNNKLKYQGLYFNPKKEWAFGKELGYSTQPWHKYTVEDAFSKKPYIADYHGQLQNLRPGANRIGDKLRKHISEGKDVKSFVDRERQLGISKIKNQTQSPEFKAYMSKLKKENPESFKNEVDRIRRSRDFKDLDFIENIYNKGYDSYVSYGGPKINPSERGLEDAYEIVLFNKPTNLKKEFKKGGVIKDDRGQWAHPGEITEIGSNNITMQGVNYPVLGVSDQGDTQMMYPEQNYQFRGNKVTEYPMMQNGGIVDKLYTTLNPYNWGVEDYTNKGDFNKAYSSAKKAGEQEFMYKGKRYNTKYAGTPRQEVGAYGVNGKPVHPMDINHPAQVNLYPTFSKNYLPGHISASVGDNETSIDYSSKGNYPFGINRVKNKGEKSFNVYGQNNLTFSNKAASLPTGNYMIEEKYTPSTWNLFTNNCADNVCDAFGIPRSKGIQTPSGAMSKIKEKYPTLDVTGRTYDDYYNLISKLNKRENYRNDDNKEFPLKKANNILNNSNKLISVYFSPDTDKKLKESIGESLQESLRDLGYDLPKSYIGGNKWNPDGIVGNETLNALKKWQSENKKQPQYPTGGKVKPIIVNNPNDPRLKAYGDSLNLYNLDVDYIKAMKKNADNLDRMQKLKVYDSNLHKFYDDKVDKAFKALHDYRLNKNTTVNSPREKGIGYNFNIGYLENGKATINNSGISSFERLGYKKPVQPVVYQPATAEQIKPLYQAPQLTMPERLELSMNKPDAVQSAEGPTFKQGRKFMRETGLRPGYYEEGGKVKENFAYDRWRRSLPENLKYEDPNYNLRGYWESLNKPELFNPMEFQTEDDGFYHASSRNPETGEILKGKLHNTLQYALDEDRKSGYFTKMKDGKIYTDTYSDGGTINNMKKRTLKKYQYSYGGLTVTDLNKYGPGGAVKGVGKTAIPNSSGAGAATTGATVSSGLSIAGAAMPMIEELLPDKTYTDSEGNDLGSRKSVGESALSSAASGAQMGMALGPKGALVGAILGGAYGTVKGFSEKDKMDKLQEEAETRITNKNINRIANTSYNWGTPNINTSTNMMFPDGGMVLNYDDPNANAELELQETFQMPDGTVGNVDGPSHEMGGIAVDLPEGTRIWSDKLKHNGKTFAKHTKPITNKIARLEKEIAKSPNNSEAKENSIALLNQQLDYYFDTQETNKQNTEMKRTLREGGMIKRADGSYSKRGLWDNIRANKGSGKKPTAEMLKQERKIRANEKAMGGYMYAKGGINNPGFRALPEEVQENILANMGMGGEMYSLGGRLMNTPMYAEGGKLPEGVLKSRLEAHMSPEEADEYLSEYGKGGYTVRRSSDRKGKTHVVIGPDGTKKYFGDPNLGERGKSKYGKEAFYARHKKNLAGNPYFRAYARATWEDGGMMGEEYAEGGIHIKPENKGKFTAYAKSHGKGVQEMAAHIMANKEDYSPTIVKRANFAKNAANWKHEMGGYLPMYQDGDMVDNPDRVAIGAINPKTGQPYTMQEVASYTDTQGMLPTPFGKQYGGLDNTGKQLYGNYEQTVLPVGYNPKVNYAQNSLTPNNIPLKDRVKFTPPAMDSDFDMNQIPEELMYNTPQVPNPYANKPFNQLPIGITRPNTNLNLGEFGANANQYIAPENLTMGDIGASTYKKPGFFNKAGQFIQNNPGLVGQLGTAALTAGSQMNRINRLARPRTLADVRLRENVANPNLVDYSAERNAIDRTALTAMEQAQRGFGSSAAAQAFKNKARLNQLEGTGRSFQGQENANAQIRNQFLAARQEAAMREAMMNNEIDKYNLENVYGYDTMTTAQKNAITAMLGNTAGQAFGKQSDYANQLQQANILANQYDPSVLNDMIKNGKLKVVDGQIVKARNGGTIKKRSFKK